MLFEVKDIHITVSHYDQLGFSGMEIGLLDEALGFVERSLAGTFGKLMHDNHIAFYRVVLANCQEVIALCMELNVVYVKFAIQAHPVPFLVLLRSLVIESPLFVVLLRLSYDLLIIHELLLWDSPVEDIHIRTIRNEDKPTS